MNIKDVIKKENIRNIPFVNFTNDTKVDKQIHKKVKTLLYNAIKNKYTETLLLMDYNNFKYLLTTDNNYNSVAFSDKMKAKISNQVLDNKIYIAIHNHPIDSGFSLDDLEQLLKYRKVFIVILVTNSCRYQAAMIKNMNLSDIEYINMLNRLDQYKKTNNVNGNYPAIDLIEEFCNEIKIFYIYFDRDYDKEQGGT